MKAVLYINENGAILIVSKYFNNYIIETQSKFHESDRDNLLIAFAYNGIEFLGEL